MVLAVAIAAWCATYSSSYRKCISDHANYGHEDKLSNLNKMTQSDPKVEVLPVFLLCEGKFIDENNGTLTAIATFAIAGFTLTLWRATALLWRAGEHQLRIADDTLKHSIGSTITMERAYLARKNIIIHPNVTDDQKFVKQWQVLPSWANMGRTPAKNVNFCSIPAVIRTDDLPADFVPVIPEPQAVSFVTIGASQEMQGGVINIDPEDFIKCSKRELRICLFFRVEYTDVFPNTAVRISQHCEELNFIGSEPITNIAPKAGIPLPFQLYGYPRYQIFT